MSSMRVRGCSYEHAYKFELWLFWNFRTDGEDDVGDLAHGSTLLGKGKNGQPTMDNALTVDGNGSLEARRMTRLVSLTQ